MPSSNKKSSEKIVDRDSAVAQLTLSLFLAATSAIFLLAYDGQFYWSELGLSRRIGSSIELAAVWLTLLSPIITPVTFLALAGLFVLRRAGSVSAYLLVLTGASALFGWLTLDLWTQRFFGTHAGQYVPYLIDAVRAGKAANQLDFAGDSQAIQSEIVKRLLFVTASGASLLYLINVFARLLVRKRSSKAAAAITRAVVYCLIFVTVAAAAAISASVRGSPAAIVSAQLPFSFFSPRRIGPDTGETAPRVRIAAILPDPYGDDAGREELHLQGRDDTGVDLTGWLLEDRRGERYSISGTLKGREVLRLNIKGLTDLFENDGDSIRLIDPAGKIIDSLVYPGSAVHRGSLLAVPERMHGDSAAAAIEKELQRRYGTIIAGINPPLPGDPAPKLEGDRPDVVYIILESFQHDGLTAMMPKLAARRAQGLELSHHNAGTNTSHLGLFSLLYGRSPLYYDSSVDSGMRPQVAWTYSASGYTTSFFTSGDCTNWRKMGDFLNARTFDDFKVFNSKSWLAWRGWPEGDAEMAAAISDRLSRGPAGPKFIAAFFMSSHFPYAYPAAYEKNLPVGDTSKLFAASGEETPEHLRNRYKNAMLYLDDLLDDLLTRIDLTKTIVVITGDHGESIWDDGTLTHGSRTSDIQTRVPLMILGRGVTPGVISAATTHLDLFPTVLHIAAGRHIDVSGIHGRDVVAAESASAAAAAGDPFFIVPLSASQPLDLVISVGGEKMLFKAQVRRPEIEAVGMIDETGFLTGKLAPAGDHEIWIKAIDELARRFMPDQPEKTLQ